MKIDIIDIYELINGNYEYDKMGSDIGKISAFAREHNVSLEELKEELQNFANIKDTPLLGLWIKTINEAIKRRKSLVKEGDYKLLNSKLRSADGNIEYAARIGGEPPVVTIVQKRKDDENGRMTGVPNAEYWDGTPGSYYVDTLINFYGDVLCIDGGSNWCIHGMRELVNELKDKFSTIKEAKLVKDFLNNI